MTTRVLDRSPIPIAASVPRGSALLQRTDCVRERNLLPAEHVVERRDRFRSRRFLARPRAALRSRGYRQPRRQKPGVARRSARVRYRDAEVLRARAVRRVERACGWRSFRCFVGRRFLIALMATHGITS
jgi:hypothetical protein